MTRACGRNGVPAATAMPGTGPTICLPEDDRAAIEEYFILPWSEHASFLEALAKAPMPQWLGPLGAIKFLAEAPGHPEDRKEDADFCNAYGLGGCRT